MSKEFDIETLIRPGGIVPINLETTAALVRSVQRLQGEVELWKDRYEAERDAHEETIRCFENADGR